MDMKIKEWPNKAGAEITYHSRRLSAINLGSRGFAVAIRHRKWNPPDHVNAWYGVNPNTKATWEELALWAWDLWKAGHPSTTTKDTKTPGACNGPGVK